MPEVTEQVAGFPRFWHINDVSPSGVLRSVLGFRIVNNTPVRVRVNAVGLTGPIDWWTPMGRPDGVVAPGEDVTARFAKALPAGAGDRWSIGYGEA